MKHNKPTADRIFNFKMSNSDAEELFQQLIVAKVAHIQSAMKWEVKGNTEMVNYNDSLVEYNERLTKIVMDGMFDE